MTSKTLAEDEEATTVLFSKMSAAHDPLNEGENPSTSSAV